MEIMDFRQHVLWFYNRYAWLYDTSEFIRRGTREKAVLASKVQKGDRVLDVCTGTGELAAAFANHGAEVVGIDISAGMLNQAVKKYQNDRISWIEMDALNLEFDTGTYDICSISLALHHMPVDVQVHVLAEMRRVCRKTVVVVEPNTPINPKLWKLWTAVANILDESEHLDTWVSEDFPLVCNNSGLKIKNDFISTFGMHHIYVCEPDSVQIPWDVNLHAPVQVMDRSIVG